MASKRPEKTYEEVMKELEQLKLENKTLKQKVKESGAVGSDDTILSVAKRESMVVGASRALVAVASRKIEAKVRSKASKAVSENELSSLLQTLTLRIDVSMSETGGAPGTIGAAAQPETRKRRPRSKSRHRTENVK